MTQANARKPGETNKESSDEETDTGTETDADTSDPHECHETVDPETRSAVLNRDGHRCQVCGRRGPERGGLATLHAHHIECDPDEMARHDLENLTTLCRSCHSWVHQQATPDDAPVTLSEDDLSLLLPQDIEILRFLADEGPTRTGDIAAGLTADLTVSAIRERLWVLMGLDNRVETRDRQIVNKDIETGEWGLTGQIENSARGHIPDDQQLLLQRMEDEQVRRALDRGCNRHVIADVLGITRRTTFHKEKRACAYDFPLGAFRRGARSSGDTQLDSDATGEAVASGSDGQQRLEDVAEGDDDVGRSETWGTPESESERESEPEPLEASRQRTEGVVGDGSGSDAVRTQLQQAIDALHEMEDTL